MVTAWFAKIANIELEQVSYRGGGQAINDLIAGHVKLGTLGSTPLIPHYKAGKLLLLAQTTAARSPALPDVPTFVQAGVPGPSPNNGLACWCLLVRRRPSSHVSM